MIAARTLLEWPLIAALTADLGTSAFALASASDSSLDVAAITKPLLPLWRAASIVALVASPLVTLDIVSTMAGVSWSQAIPLVKDVLGQTHAGRVWQFYFPALALLAVFTFAPISKWLTTVAIAAISAMMLYLEAMLSHATDKGMMAVSIYFVHEAGAGLWLGALLALWIIARRANPPEAWLDRAASRVSGIALWSVVTIVISGGYVAYLGLGFDLDHLLYSSYGRTLMVKVAIFAAVLPIGAYNRFWLIPQIDASTSRRALLRNVGVETLIIAAGVLLFATMLANTPPTHPHVMKPGMSMTM